MELFGKRQFKLFSTLIYERYGIVYKDQKEDMLKIKIDKVMKRHHLDSYDRLFSMLTGGSDSHLEKDFLDEITIHKTDFFREEHHFFYIKNHIKEILGKLPDISREREIRVWSSACSTGEEPYTIAMVLSDCLPPEIAARILGTDISKKVLAKAQTGLYSNNVKKDIDTQYWKYLHHEENHVAIDERIFNMVTFRLFNLMEPFPFKKKFHMIFCRNVLIYFDFKTQQKLIERMAHVLSPGGFLFIGHSETITNKNLNLKFIEPSIYIKTNSF